MAIDKKQSNFNETSLVTISESLVESFRAHRSWEQAAQNVRETFNVDVNDLPNAEEIARVYLYQQVIRGANSYNGNFSTLPPTSHTQQINRFIDLDEQYRWKNPLSNSLQQRIGAMIMMAIIPHAPITEQLSERALKLQRSKLPDADFHNMVEKAKHKYGY